MASVPLSIHQESALASVSWYLYSEFWFPLENQRSNPVLVLSRLIGKLPILGAFYDPHKSTKAIKMMVKDYKEKSGPARLKMTPHE